MPRRCEDGVSSGGGARMVLVAEEGMRKENEDVIRVLD